MSSTGHQEQTELSKAPRSSSLKITLFILFAGLSIWLLFNFENYSTELLKNLEHWVENAGAAAPVGATLFTGLWLTLCLPGPMILTTVTAMFHTQPWLALLILWSADTIGEVAGFLIARWVARDKVMNWIGHKPWFQWLEEQVETRGLIGVFLIRAMPFFPNSLANYAFGLTSLRFWPYTIASVLGSLPNVSLYVLGTTSIIQLFEGGLGVKYMNSYVAIGIFVLALILARALHQTSKRKLNKKQRPE